MNPRTMFGSKLGPKPPPRGEDLPCDDGEDNDSDLVADAMDPGCAGPSGSREDPACDDGVDNDGDGRLDADDPACSAANWPDSEQRRRCGAGAEVAPIVVLLAAARRHRWAARRGASRCTRRAAPGTKEPSVTTPAS